METAFGGREALEVTEAKRPDVILLDLAMPDLDGFEVIERLRERPESERTPIIVVSAHAISADERARLLEDVSAGLQKADVDGAALRSLISRTVNGRRITP